MTASYKHALGRILKLQCISKLGVGQLAWGSWELRCPQGVEILHSTVSMLICCWCCSLSHAAGAVHSHTLLVLFTLTRCWCCSLSHAAGAVHVAGASFLFAGELNGHHQELLGSSTTNHHGVAAFDFANVSGFDQLVVGQTLCTW